MHISQVLVAVVIVVIGDHFFRLAFKAHAFIASAAGDSEASVRSDNGHFATLVWTNSHAILLHVLLEESISVIFGLLASQTLVPVLFTF
jgi:hypothetical protein